MTIAEWIQEIDERAALHNLTEPNKVMYAKLSMPSQKGHLQNVKPTTTCNDFKRLVTETFERRHAQHDLLRAIQDLCMHEHDLQRYVNEFTRLKALIAANTQSDIQMMYTFINGLSPTLRTKLMSKETASYDEAVTTAWKYYMAHSYGQDEYHQIVKTQTPMDLDKRAQSRSRSITRRSTSRLHRFSKSTRRFHRSRSPSFSNR